MKIFISHSSRDVRARNRVKFHLTGAFPIWVDQSDIHGGDRLSAEIENALIDSAVMLLIWSTNARQSKWVRDEIRFFSDINDEFSSDRIIIPVVIDGTQAPIDCAQSHYYLAPGGLLTRRDLDDLKTSLNEHPLIAPTLC